MKLRTLVLAGSVIPLTLSVAPEAEAIRIIDSREPVTASGTADVSGGSEFLVEVASSSIFVRRCKKVKLPTVGDRGNPYRACDPQRGGTAIRPPEKALEFVSRATVEMLGTPQKRVALVTLSGAPGTDEAYVLAIAAPKDDDAQVNLLFKGFVGRSGSKNRFAEMARDAKGAVTFTTRASLCGREVVVSSSSLDKSGSFKSASIPDFLGAERVSATALTASELAEAPVTHPLVSTRVASSGAIAPAADRDSKTAWEPERATASFLSFDVADSVLVESVKLSLQAGRKVPSSVTLLTDTGVFTAILPASEGTGARHLSIPLPQKTATQCLGVLFDAVKDDASRPAVVELGIGTELDKSSLGDIARGLGGVDGGAREAILRAAGKGASQAAFDVYASLDDAGKERARRVIDTLPCVERLPFYGPQLVSVDKVEEDRARDRIRACGSKAGPYLIAEVAKVEKLEHKFAYAEEAGLLAPEEALDAFSKLLGSATTSDERRIGRRALAKVTARAKGLAFFDAFLGSAAWKELPLLAQIDVLRALGPAAKDTPNAASAFGETALAAQSFRDRYLLLGPAASLASAGQTEGLNFIRTQLGDEDHRIRARAAELAAAIPDLRDSALALLDDSAVRVREAAMLALSTGEPSTELEAKLAERLASDPWGFVRVQAASALKVGSNEQVNERIGGALDFEANPEVREGMVAALGARKASSQRLVVRSRANDEKELVKVRAAALIALGDMCDLESLDELTETALRGRAPQIERDRRLSAAAIAALGSMRPADLKTRLAPILEGSVPDIRELAARAVRGEGAPCK